MGRICSDGTSSLAFQNSVKLVCFQVLDDVGRARRPADFDAIDLGCRAQPEVHAKIALREIASPAADLLRLRHAPSGNLDARADRQTGCSLLQPVPD